MRNLKSISSPLSHPTLLLSLVVVVCFAAGRRVLGQSSQTIYQDGLENGWQDWSWCTRDLNNSAPVHSGTKSIAATCGAWQAVSLAHVAYSTVPYTNVIFWAHGGSAGGQYLQIWGQRNSGNPTNHYWTGPLTAGSWQRFSVPLSNLAVGGVSEPAGGQLDATWHRHLGRGCLHLHGYRGDQSRHALLQGAKALATTHEATYS